MGGRLQFLPHGSLECLHDTAAGLFKKLRQRIEVKVDIVPSAILFGLYRPAVMPCENRLHEDLNCRRQWSW